MQKTSPGRPEPVVVLAGVSRGFGAREVLRAVSQTVFAGELVGVVGPNGGGKSTLLALIAGLLRPTTGRVSVRGVDAHALALSASGTIGLVTARPGLYPLLTGRENLHHFGELFGLTPEAIDARAQPLLDRLGLERVDTPVSSWSTGMQQKLSLVRALLLSPPVLLLDEPTANLDPLVARTLWQELRAAADGGRACVVVTHDLPAAEAACDRVWLVNGTIEREVTFTARRGPLRGPLLQAWEEALR